MLVITRRDGARNMIAFFGDRSPRSKRVRTTQANPGTGWQTRLGALRVNNAPAFILSTLLGPINAFAGARADARRSQSVFRQGRDMSFYGHGARYPESAQDTDLIMPASRKWLPTIG